jgi:hypothetical protein
MFSNDIDNLIKQYPQLNHIYLGTYARDQLKSVIFHTNSFAIVNSQDSTSPGAHWYLVCQLLESQLEIWDSLGVDKGSLIRDKILPPSLKKKVICNSQRLQPPGSTLCGLYAVFCSHLRFSNTDLSQVQLIECSFSVTNLDQNDQTVSHFFKKEID